ncbi:adenylate/guanylate cyclase domain-containing protein [Rhizobium sp. 16-449-1b]|uniref:adenylate/guanylate cyclase domain-containing protein n=1 Tax=Rhizobium sp. 16-449-1b TaxID=2819989 RepID=UPI001ADA71ED|nr:adenylate/guanylate cyclase domain-containing protein [Rhizobium sp. 16-449-1b]MBO9197980.1 adenylate/guanylate cyclase domain-containing protein [Rhizobium sp. 16-449-1b]
MASGAVSSIFSERSIRRARLGSGLVMFAFAFLHFSNHALGLISVSAAEDGRRFFTALWRNPVGTLALYGAILTHIALVLRSIYIRRSLVMPKGELAQIILGLAIPILLIDHVIGTRVVHALYGYRDNYETIMRTLWITAPGNGLRQVVALVFVWFHGCIGLHYWLRYRNWYTDIAASLLVVAILVPVLAILGFIEMGRTIAEPAYEGIADNSRYESNLNSRYMKDPEAIAEVRMIRTGLYGSFAGALFLVVAARTHRRWRERVDQITVHYQGGEVVRVPRGFTVLEASRLGGIPHYSVCGGKGQCSTCRVQVLSNLEALPAPDRMEQSTLKRINAAPDVRLACQLRPTQDVTVVPLLLRATETALPANTQETTPGREREIAVLFCDIRDFTALTEDRLPFDIVFLLNRYFALVGNAVEKAGGRVDKFIGDGAMALFGIGTSPEEACRQALAAAASIARDIEKLSEELSDELSMPLRIAIGIHTGPAVVGTLGFGRARSTTAIGDMVNVASRLEAAAKEFEVALVVSEPVAALAGADMGGIESREISVRGRVLPLKVYVIPRDKAIELLEGQT